MKPFRILHITDLHLSPDGDRDPYDFAGLHESKAEQFTSKLGNALRYLPQAEWPQAVIVTGDLVQKGGAIRGEFAAANHFLKAIARFLHLSLERIYVVPGNHDIDWSGSDSFTERSRNFREAMQEFTTPKLEEGTPEPHFEPLTNVVDGVDIELVLLVSPTYSGIRHPDHPAVYAHVAETLSDWSAEQLKQLHHALERARGKIDVAAIGAAQRTYIANKFRATNLDNGPIRIAALHHHLLPDPQLEVSTFESVLDAGCVLDLLLDREFDLVLTGHKHNRRLIHYSRDRGSRVELLDVYTGPSLFVGTNPSPAGFTIIEVFGAGAPAYAALNYHTTSDGVLTERHELVREQRVMRRVLEVCRKIEPEQQVTRVAPMLEAAAKVLDWMGENGDGRHKLITNAWDAVVGDLRALSDGEIRFRPPNLHIPYGQLLDVAARVPTPYLHLVSSDDIDYWWNAKHNEFSEPRQYESCVRQFRGQKERILVFDRRSLQNEEQRSRAREVIEWMQSADIVVGALPRSVIDLNGKEPDFAIISGLVVGRFDGDDTHPARALRETFSKAAIDEHAEYWRRLKDSPYLWSKGSFDDWVDRNRHLAG